MEFSVPFSHFTYLAKVFYREFPSSGYEKYCVPIILIELILCFCRGEIRNTLIAYVFQLFFSMTHFSSRISWHLESRKFCPIIYECVENETHTLSFKRFSTNIDSNNKADFCNSESTKCNLTELYMLHQLSCLDMHVFAVVWQEWGHSLV